LNSQDSQINRVHEAAKLNARSISLHPCNRIDRNSLFGIEKIGAYTLPQSDWDADIRAVFPDWQTDTAVERWSSIRESLRVGQTVTGKVVSRAPFGVWLDIDVDQPALLLVVNMDGANTRRITFDDYPQIGIALTARINALGDRGEIGLTQQNPDTMIEGEESK
jgi:transcriptional accessory protein Tex/SPT6